MIYRVNMRWVKTWFWVFLPSTASLQFIRLRVSFQNVKEIITSTAALSTGRCENSSLLTFIKSLLRSSVTHQSVHLTLHGLCTVLLLCPLDTVDVCDLCPLCFICLCWCVSPLHLCDELLPENVKCEFSDLLFLVFASFVSMLAARQEG